MSNWYRFHLQESLKAMATPDNRRFFVHAREPSGEHRHPLQCYRWTLSDAQETADRVVQAYYPHDCDEECCGSWRRSED